MFSTSGSVLVLEILAGRLLAPYVGVTLETYTGIIGVVLAGIALGTWLGGRAADAMSPRRLLGPLLMWGGALSLVSLPAIGWLGPASVAGGPVAIVSLAFVGFFGPAAVLSAVAPTVVKLQLSDLERTGSVVGRLSALGTAGAIVGTFLTGFVLLAALPTRPIVLAVGVALTAAGLGLWLLLGHRRDVTFITLALAVSLGGSAVAVAVPADCDYETAYYCVRIETDAQRPSGRTLWLDQLRHSYVDLDDPTHLEFAYVQTFAEVIDAAVDPSRPVDVLHVGGGGFTLPRYVRATRPAGRNVVLELDGRLVELVRQELGLSTGEGLEAEVGDARLTLAAQPADAFDVVVGDAFGGLAVPWHLTTIEFMHQARRVLRPGGVYLLNLIDYPPLDFARAEVQTLRSVFRHVALITARPGGSFAGGTFVMLASDTPAVVEALSAEQVGRAHGWEMVTGAAAVEQFASDAPVLRDEYAPVDQLITQPDVWWR